MEKIYAEMYPGGYLTDKKDFTAANSKTITAGANEILAITYAYAYLMASATAGNRILVAYITDGSGDLVWISKPSGAITAGQYGSVMFNRTGGPDDDVVRRKYSITSNDNVSHTERLPDLYLLPGYSLIIKDSASIDAAEPLRTYISYVRYLV